MYPAAVRVLHAEGAALNPMQVRSVKFASLAVQPNCKNHMGIYIASLDGLLYVLESVNSTHLTT